MKAAVRKMLDDRPAAVDRRSFFKTLGVAAGGSMVLTSEAAADPAASLVHANLKTAALFGKPGLHAAGGVEAEGRATGKGNAIDRLKGAFGLEQGLLAGAGPAAAHVDRCDGGRVEQDRGDAGGDRGILGVADANAGNIGEQVFQGAIRGFRADVHGYISRGRRSTGQCQAEHLGEF